MLTGGLENPGKFPEKRDRIKKSSTIKNLPKNSLIDMTGTIKNNPKLVEPYVVRAVCHTFAGKLDAAIDDYTQAIRLKPDCAELYFRRGLIRLFLADSEGVIADFTSVIQHAPQIPGAYFLRAAAYQSKGEKDKAAVDLAKAEQLIEASRIKPGDKVVTIARTPLMDEDRILLMVDKNRPLKAIKVQKEWVMVKVEHKEKSVIGWIADHDLVHQL